MNKEETRFAFREPANNSVVITDSAGGEVLRINKDGVLVNPAYPLDEAAQYVINALDKHIKKSVLAEQPAQQEGWKLVPVDPTPEQIKAGNKVTWPMPCKQVYTAMLNATPQAQPAQQEPDYKALYEKAALQYNELAALMEQPAHQEPVAYDKTELNCFAQDLYDQKMREGKRGHYESMFHVIHQCVKKVASPPAQRKPLNAGEISRLWKQHTSEDGPHHNPYDDDGLGFARAIEAAHNIKYQQPK